MNGSKEIRKEFDRAVEEVLFSERVRSVGDLVAAAGGAFLGKPYRTGILNKRGSERLIVELAAFDCVTFVESAVALALMMFSGRSDFGCFASELQRVRYRGGRIDGYASRLHYFTDWIADNATMKILRDLTRSLGGTPYSKKIRAMSAHRNRHPAMKDEATYRRIREAERRLSIRQGYRLEKNRLREAEEHIGEGDIVAITSGEEDMDVCHVGIAVRRSGRIRLLHASSAAGRIVVSDETLYAYLRKKSVRTGVLIARIEG